MTIAGWVLNVPGHPALFQVPQGLGLREARREAWKPPAQAATSMSSLGFNPGNSFHLNAYGWSVQAPVLSPFSRRIPSYSSGQFNVMCIIISNLYGIFTRGKKCIFLYVGCFYSSGIVLTRVGGSYLRQSDIKSLA